ncbi:MAG: hypothetical protein RML48_02515 [Candidatus Bipolaricaulota bacterium]|nr:hypothetical protein [Candidatus Bipolaricaulota bacterium]
MLLDEIHLIAQFLLQGDDLQQGQRALVKLHQEIEVALAPWRATGIGAEEG